MSADESIGKRRRGSTNSSQMEPTPVRISPQELARRLGVLKEISHVLAMVENSLDRRKLLEQLWRIHDAQEYRKEVQEPGDVTGVKEPPSLWERFCGKPEQSTTKG